MSSFVSKNEYQFHSSDTESRNNGVGFNMQLANLNRPHLLEDCVIFPGPQLQAVRWIWDSLSNILCSSNAIPWGTELRSRYWPARGRCQLTALESLYPVTLFRSISPQLKPLGNLDYDYITVFLASGNVLHSQRVKYDLWAPVSNRWNPLGQLFIGLVTVFIKCAYDIRVDYGWYQHRRLRRILFHIGRPRRVKHQ